MGTIASRVTVAAAVAASLVHSIPAMTQEADEDLDEVVVTGTAIRGVAPVGSATVSISRDDMANSVSMDPAKFIADLPQGSGLAFQEVGGAGNVGRAQGVNLRGLGPNATLVLFDGHRLVGQGITEQFADPNQLPISAIERVEIVTDGASAIYGSDAVAGVVNYVLRNSYNGFEVNARRVDSLYSSNAIDVLGGFSWGSGNAWLGALYEDRKTFLRNERAYLMDDLRPFGGNDTRLVGTISVPGTAPNISTGTRIYGVPATNGALPTAASVVANLGRPNLADSGDQQWYLPLRERLAATLRLRQQFLDGRAEAQLTSIYSRRESKTREFDTFVTIPIATNSPYYIPGIAAGPLRLDYSVFLNNDGTHPIFTKPVESSLNTTLEVRFNLTDNWQLTGYGSRGLNDSCGRCGDRVNTNFVNVATSPANAALFNPYLQGPQKSFLDRAYGFQNQETSFGLTDVGAKIEGSPFSIPGGRVRVAVGGEYAEQDQSLYLYGTTLNVAGTLGVLRDTRSDRSVASGFAEVYLPIVSAENARRGISSLNVSLAARYDDYSDFGTTTNPKIGVTYQPTPALSLRASWGTSFRAPTLVETNPGVLEQMNRANYSNGAGDPTIPVYNTANGTTPVLVRIGNTPGLKPESADLLSFGFDYKPEFVDGLKVTATYYKVDYTNRIEALPNVTSVISTPQNRAIYAPFVVAAPQPTTCVNGNFATYNPLYLPFVTSPNDRPSAAVNDCTMGAIVLGGVRNLGKLKQDGVDLQITYAFPTDVGDFSLSAAGSKIFNLKRSLLPDSDLVSQLDTIGFQVSKRANARATWNRGRFGASLSATYVGGYLNNQTITVNAVRYPDTPIPSWTTLGANLSYSIPVGEGSGLTSGLRLGISAENLTDKNPPIVLTGTDAVQNSYSNVFGRIISFDISKKF